MRFIPLLVVLFTVAFAQDFSGTYTQVDDPSTVLELQLVGNEYTGTLLNEGADSFRVSAWIDEGALLGVILLREAGLSQDLVFFAELNGDSLDMIAAFADENNNPDTENAVQYSFIRAGQAGQISTPTRPETPSDSGSAAVPFSGSYAGQGTNLILVYAGNGYQGELHYQGRTFPLEAHASGNILSGSFLADGQSYPFEAILQGSTLTFNTGGQSYALTSTGSPVPNQSSTPAVVPSAPTSASVGSAVQAGQSYPAGSTVTSPWTGISFVVPQGFNGQYDASFEGFIMTSAQDGSILYVEGAGQATALALGEAIIESVAARTQQEPQPISFSQPQGDSIVASYLLGDGMLHGTVRQGPAGNAVVVLAFGYQPERLAQLVQSVDASVRFSGPQSPSGEEMLAGYTLSSTGQDDLYSPGGVGGGSFTSGGEQHLTFCQDRTYGFESSSVSIVSVDGAGSMRSSDSDAHQGSYYLTHSFMGETALVLNANDGRSFMHFLVMTGQAVFLDGQPQQVSQSQWC